MPTVKAFSTTRGTTDEVRAHELFARRLQELRDARDAGIAVTKLATRPPLHVAVADYLSVRGQELVTHSWVAAHASFLGKAVTFFGAETKLGAVTVEDVVEFMAWLRRRPTPQGRPYSEQSIRHHLLCALGALPEGTTQGLGAAGRESCGPARAP
jgi:hypothetical protein